MKVLHVCASDSEGGAARAAARLHRAERQAGIDSTMLVAQRLGDDPFVAQAEKSARERNALVWGLERRLLRNAPDASSIERSLNLVPTGLDRHVNASGADVVHLHRVNDGMMSVAEIGRITKPIVWTLHDMWPFAGAEHYTAGGDDRWRTGYVAGSLDGWTWRRKRRHWRHLTPVLVAPSRWMADRCRASALFRQHEVRVIPNPIDPAESEPGDVAAVVDAYASAYDAAIRTCRGAGLTLERLGPDGGGWTIPSNMLRRGDICYSMGLADDVTFELIQRYGCQPTVSPGGARGRLPELMATNGHVAVDLLILGVEGAEHEIIDSLVEDGVPVRLACVEFRAGRGQPDSGFLHARRLAVAKLERAGFRIVSYSGDRYTLAYRP